MKAYFHPISRIFQDNWKRGLSYFSLFFLLILSSAHKAKINPIPDPILKDEEPHTQSCSQMCNILGNLRMADIAGTILSDEGSSESIYITIAVFPSLFFQHTWNIESKKLCRPVSRLSIQLCLLLLLPAHYWAPICTHEPPPCPQPAPAVWKEKASKFLGSPSVC